MDTHVHLRQRVACNVPDSKDAVNCFVLDENHMQMTVRLDRQQYQSVSQRTNPKNLLVATKWKNEL